MYWGVQLGSGGTVNYDFHENLTTEKIDKVLDEYRKKATQ